MQAQSDPYERWTLWFNNFGKFAYIFYTLTTIQLDNNKSSIDCTDTSALHVDT